MRKVAVFDDYCDSAFLRYRFSHEMFNGSHGNSPVLPETPDSKKAEQKNVKEL